MANRKIAKWGIIGLLVASFCSAFLLYGRAKVRAQDNRFSPRVCIGNWPDSGSSEGHYAIDEYQLEINKPVPADFGKTQMACTDFSDPYEVSASDIGRVEAHIDWRASTKIINLSSSTDEFIGLAENLENQSEAEILSNADQTSVDNSPEIDIGGKEEESIIINKEANNELTGQDYLLTSSSSIDEDKSREIIITAVDDGYRDTTTNPDEAGENPDSLILRYSYDGVSWVKIRLNKEDPEETVVLEGVSPMQIKDLVVILEVNGSNNENDVYVENIYLTFIPVEKEEEESELDPDLLLNGIKADKTANGYRLIRISRQDNEIEQIWVARERHRKNDWYFVAEISLPQEAFVSAIHEDSVFWLSSEHSYIYKFDITTQSYSSRTYDPKGGDNFLEFTGKDGTSIKAVLNEGASEFNFINNEI